MLNGRLYRAAFVPLVFALAIAAFSLSARPHSLDSTLAPDAFEGAKAFSELTSLADEYPHRRPGSTGDQALAAHVEETFKSLGGTAGGGFMVHTRHFTAQTIDGQRSLTTVIAQRPGSTDATPIVILAHRDAAAGGARAELSATAALLELARVFASRETQRTIILVSTSGGSGGDAGAADYAANARGPSDAAIVLGDLAGARERKPFVVPFSDGFGSAPVQLQRTVEDAITQETGSDPGSPSALGQLAHLAFHFTVGEQGPLDQGGIPAVLVQVSGERGPPSGDRVSAARLEGFGRAVLSAVDALDTSPDMTSAKQTGVNVQRQTIPAWAVRLIVAALLLPPLIAAADGLARARRRRMRVAKAFLWTLACAAPFFLAALFARLLGALGIVGAAPSTPVSPTALPFNGAAARAVIAVLLVLALVWLLWPVLLRRLDLKARPDSDAAGMSMLLVLLLLSVVVWAVNPFTALLLVPAVHLWLLIASPELRPRPPAAVSLVAIALLPLALLVAFYAHQLGMGPGQLLWTAVLLFAGGHIGVPSAVLWSVALGCATAAAILAVAPSASTFDADPDDRDEVRIRGPLSYAGPGSLGGTESALRR
jgi:hypothetical protein